MKAIKGNLRFIPRAIVNTDRTDRPQWARIVIDGKVVHTGQLRYIKRIAKAKYNLDLDI